MEEKLLRHYRLELDFLRQLGIEFAAAHPDIAGHLGMPYQSGMDPHVERLREGFALLTARIRAKIEDEQPELTEALLGVLYPQLTQPIPSMSVIRFKVAADQWAPLSKGVVLEAGAVLKSERSGNEPACEFRTTYPVHLWPLSVEPVLLNQQIDVADARGIDAVAVLTIPVRCLGMTKLGQLDAQKFRTLRFYLGGEGHAPFLLRERLIHDVVRIELREHPVRPDSRRLVLAGNEIQARRILRPVGFAESEGVLPRPDRALLGHSNLREFFAFPQKFLFVDLDKVETVVPWTQATGFDVRLFLRRLPGGVIRKESMQLFCTPIVNLFARTCRIDRDQTRVEYPVEAPDAREAINRDFFEVFSIDSVRPFDAAGSSNREYPRYDDFRARSFPGKRTCWYARRRASTGPENKRTHVLLSFVDEGKQMGPPEDPSITVQTTCTNLDLPTRLPSLVLRLERVAPIAGVEPVAPLSRAQPPPPSREYHWRLISHLALNHLAVGDPPSEPGKPRAIGRGTQVLREILRLSDPLGNDATRRQIEAIRHVESRHEFRSLPHDRRAVVGGVCVTIDFGEEAMSQGGLLLAELIDQFLAHYVSINAFSRLTAIVGQKKVREWEPRSGEKILL
jgi:type VI secretion system protein ImpG